MHEAVRCSQCRQELPKDAPEGRLCPRCLLKIGLEGTGGEPQETLSTAQDASTGGEPDVIGPYRILDKLGEGGMGVVYVAEQTEPVRRKVALKLIKLGMDSKQVIARFEAERQALALMNHPNVAQVFDAGVSDRGRPYFVMEYVPGIPITEYSDLRCLSLRERLGLFVQVCDAIQHAHQKGIIHRDVKPTNVLVSSEDGKVKLKVIDFGVAKATSQRLTERTLYTQQGVLVGTPEYMSPEQARTTALEVDTRTDIYSLGVLLYELLVGTLPFDAQTLRRAATVEMLRIIREEDPPRPTTKFSSLGDTAAEIAKRRHADPRSLTRQLRGELEWITMRALEKDPGRRYGSASELAADVQRHLSDEPVIASPPSHAYRLRKFARKNRGTVVATTIIIGLLVAGLAVSMTMYLRSEVARQWAEDEASRNALELRALQSALWDDAGRYREWSREALEAHRRVLGADNPALAPYLVNRLYILDFSEHGIPWDEREELEREAVAFVERGLREGHPDALMSAVLLTDVLKRKDAIPLYRRALAIVRDKLVQADDQTVSDMLYLAETIENRGARLLEAVDDQSIEGVYREALDRRREVLPPGTPVPKRILNELANVIERRGERLLRAGDFGAAEPVYREILELLDEAGLSGTPRMAEVDSDLGACLVAGRQFDEAERLLVQAHRILEQESGPESAVAQQTLGRLVELYEKWGRPDQAARFRARLPEVAIGQVWDLGPIELHESLSFPGGGYSALLDGRSVWALRQDRVVRAGREGSHPTHAPFISTTDLEASDGLDDFREGDTHAGIALSPIPLTAMETTVNAALAGPDCPEPCNAGWFLTYGPIIADPQRDRLIVFYSPILRQPPWDDERAGASLAVCSRETGGCARPVVRPGAEDPTLLFDSDEPAWSSAALVASDQMYAYACECRDLGCSCLLARVPLGAALDRSAWRFFASAGNWSGDWRDAEPVLEGAIQSGMLEVHWNRYLNKYLAISSRTVDARIEIRVADRPEGPWSEPAVAIDTIRSTPGWFWTYAGLGHPEFSREGGRIEYLTFARSVQFGPELRLLEVRFQ